MHQKAPFDLLAPTILALGTKLLAGQLTLTEYQEQYRAFALACGWEPAEILAEIDRRWTPQPFKAVKVEA